MLEKTAVKQESARVVSKNNLNNFHVQTSSLSHQQISNGLPRYVLKVAVVRGEVLHS